LPSYLRELVMLLLAQRAQSLKSFMLGTAAPAHQNPDSPID